MKKVVIVTVNELIVEIEKVLPEGKISLTTKEEIIDNEVLVGDFIEIKKEIFNNVFLENINKNITNEYEFENNSIFIDLHDLKEFVSKLANIETTGTYDFLESNINGDMEVCINFEIA